MNAPNTTLFKATVKRMYGWPRLRVMLAICGFWLFLFTFTWTAAYWILPFRLAVIGFSVLTVFGLFEVWPRRLPRWMARWALQVFMVALVIPFAVALSYQLAYAGIDPPWYKDMKRLESVFTFMFLGLLIAPWAAAAALFKQIRNEAERQALAFDLEKSRYEQQATQSRMSLLQAQVQPHFLFNTLANVRELVATGSPNAPKVLDSLIAYLKAAVPRLNEPLATMAQEVELARSYLEVMHMRMPDRLQYSIHADEDAQALRCPPMTLLTLVENAMRHGIDPTEDGGRIDVRVHIVSGCCCVQVTDTGRGLATGSDGLGTGLANLKERLTLAFGDRVKLQLVPVTPRGVTAELLFPVSAATESK
ncbi:MAG: histidine kinase [Betaproteobacteria bacterium]|nr:histidine kinase [Betaproteobacteria bacterium]